MRNIIALGTAALALSACSMSSSVMDAGNGTYAVTGQASPLRGGGEQAAHNEAVKFCARQGGSPVVEGVSKEVFDPKVTMHFRCNR